MWAHLLQEISSLLASTDYNAAKLGQELKIERKVITFHLELEKMDC
jgi:hypothetical protein